MIKRARNLWTITVNLDSSIPWLSCTLTDMLALIPGVSQTGSDTTKSAGSGAGAGAGDSDRIGGKAQTGQNPLGL